jgi:hypothetical protein
MVLEPCHVDDAPRNGRLKVSHFVTSLIIQVVTKNSTTRGWPSLRIAQEVSSLLPGKQTVSASTVYRIGLLSNRIESNFCIFDSIISDRIYI